MLYLPNTSAGRKIPAPGVAGLAHPENGWASIGTNLYCQPESGGLSWKSTTGGTNRQVTPLNSGVPSLITSTSFSVLVFAKPGATSSSLCGGGAVNSAGGWVILQDKMQYRTIGSTVTLTYTAAPSLNEDHVFIFTGSSSGTTAYVDGVSQATSGSAIQSASPTAANCWVVGDNSVTNRGVCAVYFVAYFNRTLTPEEVLQYSNNPYLVMDTRTRKKLLQIPSSGRTGSMTAVEPTVDTLSAVGTVLIKGSFNVIEPTKDTFNSSGKVIVQGTATIVESSVDVFSGVGSTSGGRTGSMTAIEPTKDVLSSSGTVLIQGTASIVEPTSDTFYGTNVVSLAKCVNSKWTVQTGSNGGTLQVQMASEVGGVDVTLKEGLFFLKYRKI